MNITIIGRKCTPRESFKERAELKLKKVEKFFGPEADAKVTATVEKTLKLLRSRSQRAVLYSEVRSAHRTLRTRLINVLIHSFVR